MENKYCRVIKDYKSPFPNPLILKRGEKLQIEDKESEWHGWIWSITKSGQSGWIPDNYLKISGNTAVLLKDYNATELTASVGEIYLIEDEESGWVWVTSENGKYGWIPLENVEIL
ncbi:MAG: SH3 domain-containing protein [Candidatus Hodarchaeota archaeon]